MKFNGNIEDLLGKTVQVFVRGDCVVIGKVRYIIEDMLLVNSNIDGEIELIIVGYSDIYVIG